MKKSLIAILSLFFLALPFIALSTVYLIFKINIFDNPEFWYGYMAYFGTVALAAVAVWQNRIIKEENDKSQERLERLTIQANELTVISKIIENESQNLLRLKIAFDEFSYACDPQVLSTIYANSTTAAVPTIAIQSGMATAEKRMDDSFFALSRELRIDPQFIIKDESPFKLAIAKYYSAAKNLVEKGRTNPTQSYKEDIDILTQARNDFVAVREKYLIEKENKLNRVIYGKMTLDEIKNLYNHSN